MDENKRKKLHDIGFKVLNNCGLCTHGTFPNNDWGTCAITTYDHLKHTGDPRELSIHRFGSCDRFDPSWPAVAGLAAFDEYRTGRAELTDITNAVYYAAGTTHGDRVALRIVAATEERLVECGVFTPKKS